MALFKEVGKIPFISCIFYITSFISFHSSLAMFVHPPFLMSKDGDFPTYSLVVKAPIISIDAYGSHGSIVLCPEMGFEV